MAREGVVAFQSLSKRSAMTCYRIGWVAGDPEVIAIFKKVKTNVDSGTATFIQDGAVAALGDEEHVRLFREEYRAEAGHPLRGPGRGGPRGLHPRGRACTSGSGCPRG